MKMSRLAFLLLVLVSTAFAADNTFDEEPVDDVTDVTGSPDDYSTGGYYTDDGDSTDSTGLL
jgi:hypothetical protein